MFLIFFYFGFWVWVFREGGFFIVECEKWSGVEDFFWGGGEEERGFFFLGGGKREIGKKDFD